MSKVIVFSIVTAMFLFLTSCNQTESNSESTVKGHVSLVVDDANETISSLEPQFVVGDNVIQFQVASFSITNIGATAKCPAPDSEKVIDLVLTLFNQTGQTIQSLEHPNDTPGLDELAEDPVASGLFDPFSPTGADNYIGADYTEGIFNAPSLGPLIPFAAFPYKFNYCRLTAIADATPGPGGLVSGNTNLLDIFFYFVSTISPNL